MRIAMIGTGYVGLVSGACFSEFGVSVRCVDQDAAKIAGLQRGEMPV
jgi:UDPglucose 6-dehydrogenase